MAPLTISELLASPTPAAKNARMMDAELVIRTPTSNKPTKSREGATRFKNVVQEQTTDDVFRVKDLPRELRCMIWEWSIFHDDVRDLDTHPKLQEFPTRLRPSFAVRRYVPGYFRPTALLTRYEEFLRRDYSQVYLLDRVPSLFLVNKQTSEEAREVAFRRVAIEIDKPICKQIIHKWAEATDRNPLVHNMRNLFVCTTAKIPRPVRMSAPMSFGRDWPPIEFNWRRVPLFHIAISTDCEMMTIWSQRDFMPADRQRLDSMLATWMTMLPPDTRFNSESLVLMAGVLREVQDMIGGKTWTLRLDDRDKTEHRGVADAQAAHENKTGDR